MRESAPRPRRCPAFFTFATPADAAVAARGRLAPVFRRAPVGVIAT
jgi:hypothetical protein